MSRVLVEPVSEVRMPVTIADVARLAGVSTATVSYVVNNSSSQRISNTTRATVLRAAEELGYRPNAAARSLRTGRGSAVLLPLPGLQPGHVLGQLINSCTATLAERQLSLVTDFTHYATPAQAIAAWSRLNPAAVLDVVLPHDAPLTTALRAGGIPLVAPPVVDDRPWESHGDTFARQERLTQLGYLLNEGHRRITFALPRPADGRMERRMLKELRRLASLHDAAIELRRVQLTDEGIRQFAQEWLTQRHADAIACLNDDFAMAIITALSSEGVRVPDDLAVMGVDDVPLAGAFTPPITTIAADFSDFAYALAATVSAAVAGETHADPVPLPRHEVIVRQSA